MFAYDEKSMEALAAPAREMFEQWISFFPTAPLFGVEWRFADGVNVFPGDLNMLMPGVAMFSGYMPAKSAKSAATRPAKARLPRKAAKPEAKEQAVAVEKAPASAPDAAPKAAKSTDSEAPRTPVNDGGSVDQIRGIGPRLSTELAGMGITTVAQIAALSRSELAKIDAELTSIKGRCFRDDWVGQAKALLAA